MASPKPSWTWSQTTADIIITVNTFVKDLSWSDVMVEILPIAVSLNISRASGSDICFEWDELSQQVDLENSSWDLEGSTVIIKLAKAQTDVTWSSLEVQPVEVQSRAADATDVGIQIMSDLHLEFQWATPPRGSAPGYDVFVPPVTAENLALLGDIGIIAHSDSLFHFLEQQLTRFKRVFYLAGNHEYYGTTYEEAQVKFRQFAERVQQRRQNEPELGEFVLLHRTRYDFPGTNVTVLGCTLWSDIPIEDAGMVRAGLNDFQCIAGWTTDEHTRIHREEVAWLTTEMEQLQREAPSRKVAILTHHAPTFQRTSDPKFKDSPINAGFATELTGCKQLWNPNLLKVWAFGHTHWLCDHDVHGVRLYANQRGYEGAEARQLCFNPSAVVFI